MEFIENGLDAADKDVYLAVLETPGMTRAELAADIPGLAPARVVRSLKTLQAQGLITTTTAGRALRYVPIPPDVGIEMLARRRIESARTLQQLIPDLMDTYWRANQSSATDFVEIVTGSIDTLAQRNRQLRAAARERVRSFERPPFAWQQVTGIAADLSVALESLARGVVHMVLYDQEQVENPDRWNGDIRRSLEAGELARVLPSLPPKMTLYDDVAARTPLVDARGEYLGTVVIHQSPVLDALSALFDAYWERAVPITLEGAPEAEAPAVDRLVMMLSAGYTDAAIARSLKVSRSTVQRRVNELMESTGSRTRFQLGLQLGRRQPVSG